MENNIMNNSNISVSILNVDELDKFLIRLRSICKKRNLDNVIVHFDVMDGVFVPNSGVDFLKVQNAKKLGFYTDVHLMVEDPMKYISKLVQQGVDSITVHYEIEDLALVLTHLNRLKSQKKIKNIGLAIKPETDIQNIHEYYYLIDSILIMSVNPGAGGQKYIEDVNEKIIALKYTNKIIEVDGGVNDKTLPMAKKCGATSFVVGSYLTSNINNLEENLCNLYDILK